jgi:small subunit ribosomal protein S18
MDMVVGHGGEEVLGRGDGMKVAREMALLPYAKRVASTRTGGRGRDGGREGGRDGGRDRETSLSDSVNDTANDTIVDDELIDDLDTSIDAAAETEEA